MQCQSLAAMEMAGRGFAGSFTKVGIQLIALILQKLIEVKIKVAVHQLKDKVFYAL